MCLVCAAEAKAEEEARIKQTTGTAAEPNKDKKVPGVTVHLDTSAEKHSVNFKNDVSELQDDRLRDLRRVSSSALDSLLEQIHATDPHGVLRALLTDTNFIKKHRIGDLLRCSSTEDLALNLLANAVDSFNHEDSKAVQRQILAVLGCEVLSSGRTLMAHLL